MLKNFAAIPISYSIPSSLVISSVMEKDRFFAPLIPGDRSTYIYSVDDETKYHHDYRRSYFGHTKKKAAWDSLRHYEILANGCVPYFDEIEECPRKCCVYLPKHKLIEAKKMALRDRSSLWERDYYSLAEELLLYTREFLTTRAVASRFLGWFNQPIRILMLGSSNLVNYCCDLLLHGLSELNLEVIDVPKVSYMFKDSQIPRASLYGYGFSYAFHLMDRQKNNRENIYQRIKDHEFDLVILSLTDTACIGGVEDYFRFVSQYYSNAEVAVVDGRDDVEVLAKLFPGAKYFKCSFN